MNTAQLRKLAWDAYSRAEYALAADLYAQAIAAYPPYDPSKNTLAALDVQKLREQLNYCKQATFSLP